ncbi:PREDICTED: pentatricopeptide repeat-containing protein At5g50390, chloroplastic-like isoform X2 [Tarenaya hassleriana]|nr:PREDICTED: pentatricopeptide repeat-containing protein At5g50390, chloroplastic-like isoform X2 [Tarenaya hassleriana]
MEIPLARYQSILLDQIHESCSSSSFQLSYSFPKVFNFPRKYLFSGYGFSLNRKKWKNSFGRIVCSSLVEQLKPKPQLKPKREPNRVDAEEVEDPVLKDTQIRKSSLRICSQIEKLVLCNKFREAFELFEILEIQGCLQIGVRTYDALVTACIGLRSIRCVKRVFGYMINSGFEPDQLMMNRILLMHVKCGMMIDARRLFDEMPERNLVSFNNIIVGLVGFGNYLEAFRLFQMMLEEFSDSDSRTFAMMFSASAGLGSVYAGKQLHACVMKMGIGDDTFVSCALIDMYGKCGCIEDAQSVFDDMPEKATVAWNNLIKGYLLHGYSEEALCLLYEMQDSGACMDHFTFSIVVGICTRLAKLELTKQAHASIIRRGFGSDLVLNSTLVDFYSKWGRVDAARNVFDKMPYKNLISWNTLMFGYAHHGRGAEAVRLFEKMNTEKVAPNHVTFLAVLSACANSSLLELGWDIFQSMTGDHKIKPRAMHYACMIELLGREGLLDEAFALIRRTPFKATANMWAALLDACRAHGNMELGKLAAEKLYGMEPEKLGNYVVLFNLYNSMGKREEATGVLKTLRDKGLRIMPACSWVEVRDQTHCFLSGDKCDTYGETVKRQIYQKSDDLMEEIRENGCLPEGEETLLPDVEENEERVLRYHSEKLALAYGLINTPNWKPLQITQSHRMCNDCHKTVQFASLVSGREIVVRDASKFHHFKQGQCSCGGYW